jgi:hypothetical protein
MYNPEIFLILILWPKVVLEYMCQKDAFCMLGYSDWKLFILYEMFCSRNEEEWFPFVDKMVSSDDLTP